MTRISYVWLDGPQAPLLVLVEAIEAVEPLVEIDVRGHVRLYNGEAKPIGSTITLTSGTQIQVAEPPQDVLDKVAFATEMRRGQPL